MRSVSHTLAIVLLLAGTARADYLETARHEAAGQVVDELLDLAKWCVSTKLYRSRDEVYELIMAFDADQPTARRKLRYVRVKGGGWRRNREMPETRDRLPAFHAELEQRRRAIGTRFGDALVPLVEKAGTTGALATRERVLREIFLLHPDHEGAHRANGEVRAGARWVLLDTQRAVSRRAALREAVRQALDKAGPAQVVEPTEEERSYGVQWNSALDGGGWRLLCAIPALEAPSCLRVADATDPLFESVLGMGGKDFPARRLFMLTGPAQFQTLLSNHPKISPALYKREKDLASTWLPASHTCVTRVDQPERRIEWAARQPLGFLLQKYYGVTTRNGWIWEGVGLYLTHQLTGYRRSTFVRHTRYVAEKSKKSQRSARLWASMQPVRADWFRLAADMVARGHSPDWTHMLAKDTSQMDTHDLLASYMLAAYLIETQHERLPAILKEIGTGKASAAVLQKSLGMPLAALEARVYRWAAEHERG